MPVESRNASSHAGSLHAPFARMLRCVVMAGALIATTAVLGQTRQAPGIEGAADDADARALVDATISRDVLRLVDQLNADTFEQRDAATHRLTGLVTRRECELLLRLNTLAPEQRYRMLEVLRTTVVDRPRGAIGIEMGPGAVMRGGNPEVVVKMVVENMPSSRVLQVDDRITHVDGQPVPSNTYLIDYVQLRSPGDTVTLSIRRPHRDEQGRIKYDENHQPICDDMDVEITLGQTTQLDNPANSTAVQQQIRSAERTARGLMPRPILLRFASGSGIGWDEPPAGDDP